MTDSKTTEKEVKDLPDLRKIESQDWFKTAYDAHKSDEYRTMLDDLEVGYLASDNKTALTYRYLEATSGLQNATQAKPVVQTEEHKTVQPTEPALKTGDTNATPAKEIKNYYPKSNAISVKNQLSRDVLEPATGTRIIAGETTKITPTAKVTRERILSNLNQLNALNGNQLAVEDNTN